QTFANPTPEANDRFGVAVAAVGPYLAVGAPGDDKSGLDAGAVYLFDPATGLMVKELLNPNPAGGSGSDDFGSFLAGSGTLLLVSAPRDDFASTDSGSVYLYDGSATSPTFATLLKRLHSPNGGSGNFGKALALQGDRALIGAPLDNQTVAASGTAFL